MSDQKTIEARVRENPPAVSALEVARLAGVAVVTVSRSFNHSPLVTPTTRDRVLAAARELGYRPSAAARALSKGRANSIALVFRTEHLFGHFYSELMAGMNSVIIERDFTNLLTVIPQTGNIGGWLRQLVRGSAPDALVLHYEIVRDVGADLILELGIPIVVAGFFPDPSEAEASLPSCGFNHADGVQQAIRHLVALGHRDISYLDSPGKWRGPSTRQSAFRNEMKEAGIPVREEWIIDCTSPSGPTAGFEAMQRIFSQRGKYPTAIFCGSDLIAAGAITGAAAWGRKVPDDLSICGYEDSAWSPFFIPPLTTVHQRGWDLGVVVGEKLMENFTETRKLGLKTTLPMRLVIRNSTAMVKPD